MIKFTAVITDTGGEAIPKFVIETLSGKFPRRFFEFRAENLIGLVASGKAHNADRGRQGAIRSQIIKGWNEFAVREVAGRAENHKCARVRHSAGGESLSQRICSQSFCWHE